MAVGARHLPHPVKGAADLEFRGKLDSAGWGVGKKESVSIANLDQDINTVLPKEIHDG